MGTGDGGASPSPANWGRPGTGPGERPRFWPGELPRSLIGGLRVGREATGMSPTGIDSEARAPFASKLAEKNGGPAPSVGRRGLPVGCDSERGRRSRTVTVVNRDTGHWH
jgi:hypothetical protein